MSDDQTYVEQRRSVRHPGPFDGWSIGNSLRQVRVTNLGLGGGFISVNSGTEVGERFQLKIRLDGEGLLDVIATTLYHTMNGTAVTFMKLSPGSYGQIQRIVGASSARNS